MVIPEYVQSIGDWAFHGVTIDEVIVHSIPFELSTSSVFGSPYKTLVVPKGTRDIFGTREGWKRFNKIIEGEFEPTFNVSDYPAGDWSLPSDGYEITQDNVTYKLYKSGVARVYTKYYPASGELVIPESVYAVGHTFPVDGVEYFKTSSGYVVDLKLPNTITFVNSVKGGVQVLTLPAAVTSVSDLYESTDLQSFVVAEGNAYFSVDENGILYNKDKTILRYAPYGKRSSFTSFTVPSTVITVGANAFKKFDKLQNVTIPSSVKAINGSAFQECSQLLSVSLSEGLESVGNNAFSNCGNLSNCKFPNSLQTIGESAFTYCSLSNFSLPGQLRTIGNDAFEYGIKNRALSTLVIPEYVQSIGDWAFHGVTINEVRSRVMEPQPIGTSNVFGSPTNQVLVVPTGTIPLYVATAGWNKIPSIIESDDLLPTSVRCLLPQITRSENTLTITAQPEDAKIYYTLDGKDPSANSELYEKPLVMTGNCTVKAIAKKEGLKDSPIASFTVDWFTVADVEIRVTDDLAIEMTTKTEGASIRYTLDGTDPTENGYVYPNKPVSIGDDCTIKAVGMKANYNNSKITTYELKWAQLTCPKPTFRLSGTKLYIESKLADATIYYTMDGTEPTISSPQYILGDPIELTTNCTIKAFVTKKGYRNSEVETYVASAFNVSSPEITREGNTLYITTETTNATIYYTMDGNDPTKNSTKYDANSPIVVSSNCVVKAVAMREGYNNSPVTTFTVDWFAVANVNIRINDELMIEMTTETEGATIRYTLNGEDPVESGQVYQGKPLYIEDDCTIKAVGQKANFNDSKVTVFALQWAQFTCSEPTFRLSGTKLYIESKMEGVTIYYTMDGSEPTKNSLKYTGEPVELSGNCIVKAIATKAGYRNSKVVEQTISDYMVSTPSFTQNGTQLTITCVEEGVSIYYGIGEDAECTSLYNAPIELTDNRPVYAIGRKEGFDPSTIAVHRPTNFTCEPAKFDTYNGRFFTLNVQEGATAYYTTDGSEPTEASSAYGGPTPVDGLCKVRWITTKPWFNNSSIAEESIKYFFDNGAAEITEAGQLSKALEWTNPADVTTLQINGKLNADDLAYIKQAFTNLEHLDLSNVDVVGNSLPEGCFAGMPFITFTSPKTISSIGNRILADCPNLAAVIWNSNERLTNNTFGDHVNPNMLVYVFSRTIVPGIIHNVIVENSPADIILVDQEGNNNFYCPRPFVAKKISYTHHYDLETIIGSSAGWETISLPFTVQKITHDQQGDLMPYLKFEQEGSPETGRPFWLKEYKEGGFEDAAAIEANTPYIISMPNNKEYATRYNLKGNVTFSAEQTQVLASTDVQYAQNGRKTLIPNFVRKAKSSQVYAINKDAVWENFYKGSVFVNDWREVGPFEAYIVTNTSMAPPYFAIDEMGGNTTTIDNLMLGDSIQCNALVKVYNMAGYLVTQGKHGEVMKQLPSGVYIVNGKKVVVK